MTDVEVATTAADTMRASVCVSGALSPRTTPLLTTVLSTHVRAGRRYLRLDLAAADVRDPATLRSLGEARAAVEALGGTLAFVNAPAELAAGAADTADTAAR